MIPVFLLSTWSTSMVNTFFGFDPFFMTRALMERPVLYSGVLFRIPLAMGFSLMMPFMPMFDFRTPVTQDVQ